MIDGLQESFVWSWSRTTGLLQIRDMSGVWSERRSKENTCSLCRNSVLLRYLNVLFSCFF